MFARRKQVAFTRVEAREVAQSALNDWSDDASRNGVTEAEQIAMLAAKLERLRVPIQR